MPDARRAETVVCNSGPLIALAKVDQLELQCKKAGHVSAIRPLLEEMRSNGYFLSERLIEGICQAGNEY